MLGVFPARSPDVVRRYVTALPTRPGPMSNGAGTCADAFAPIALAMATEITATAERRDDRKGIGMTSPTIAADAVSRLEFGRPWPRSLPSPMRC